MFQFASAGNAVSIHPNKSSNNKSADIQAPRSSPLYLQVDSPDQITLLISFSVCHPRVLLNSGNAVEYHIDPGYLFFEKFQWFEDADIPKPYAFLQTRGYDSTEIKVQPGRHFFK